MQIENKLIIRRLIAGIILLLLSIFEMVESYHAANYGQYIGNNSLNSEGGLGMFIGGLAFIVALVFIFTSKSRPKKWVETVLGVLIVIGILMTLTLGNKYFEDLQFFGWLNLVVSCFAFPWSRKGFKGMPFISKNEKETEQPLPKQEADTNVPDEIAKYKKLLDDGTITKEEFEAKKKQLLNL